MSKKNDLKDTRFHMVMTSDLRKILEDMAWERRVSTSEMVRQLIENEAKRKKAA